MPQTTDQISFVDADIEYQIEGDPTPTPISGFSTALEVSGFESQIGEAYTGDADTAILAQGKTTPADVLVRCVYTDGATDPYTALWEAKEAKEKVKFIWYPEGKVNGNKMLETDYGFLTKVTPPVGEFSSPDILLFEASIKTAKITPGTYSST